MIWTLHKEAWAFWHYGLAAAIAVALVFGIPPLFRWVDDKETASQLAAHLTRYTGVIFAPGGQAGSVPLLQMGTSGAILDAKGTGRESQVGALLFPALSERQFKIELIGGKIKVSTQIADENGKLIAELNRNEWKVAPAPMTWDRNYTNDALEVRDSTGMVALQVRVLADRIQMQGMWWIDMGPPNGIRRFVMRGNPSIGGQINVVPKDSRDIPIIEPMFLYPSDQHLGELRK